MIRKRRKVLRLVQSTENQISPLRTLYIQNNEHMINRLNNTSVENYPYPHFFINNIFTDEFYQFLRTICPLDSECPNLKELGLVPRGYPDNRQTLPIKDYLRRHTHLYTYVTDRYRQTELRRLYNWFKAFFLPRMLTKFNIQQPAKMYDELLYVVDSKGYGLHSHTDYEMKIFSALFYMPTDNIGSEYGTNIDIPEDPTYTSSRNKFNPTIKFNIWKTVPFVQNSMFAFLRTDNSFHSVSKIDQDIKRYTLVYDIKKDL